MKQHQQHSEKNTERAICEIIGSAFIEEIGGSSSLIELSSLPLLFRELHDDCLKKLFGLAAICVLAFGGNDSGQLGIGDTRNRYRPEVIETLNEKQLVKIVCGAWHSIAFLRSGEILSWGSNFEEDGIVFPQEIISKNPLFSEPQHRVLEIACGANHNILLTTNGDVYSWGWNSSGQLGLGDNRKRSNPEQIGFFKGKKISKVFCGFYHSYSITKGDMAYAWGRNIFGQLGIGNSENQSLPQKIESLSGMNVASIVGKGVTHSIALTSNGTVLFAGGNNFNPFDSSEQFFSETFHIVSGLSGKNIISIDSGHQHCVALQDSGEFYIWGDNKYSQLGFGDHHNRLFPEKIPYFGGKFVTNVICGEYHTIAMIETNGESKKVFGWGFNQYGALGIGDLNERTIPTELQLPLNGKKINDIACGNQFTFVLLQ